MPQSPTAPSQPNIFSILKPYRGMVAWLVLFALVANGLSLFLPAFTAKVIDSFVLGSLDLTTLMIEYALIAAGVFIFLFMQGVMQAYVSEKVARDMRSSLVEKISKQGYRFIEERDPAKLLTNLTSDIDSIKMFVAQAIASIVSSVVIIIGVAAILISIDWRLGLTVLTILPIIGGAFFVIFGMVRVLFLKAREAIDRLNRVINESILGAALIRVLYAQHVEHEKFKGANAAAQAVGLKILNLFAFMIPIVTFVSGMGTLAITLLGGYYVIQGSMTLGSFAAFNSYIMILIFPIFVLGFMSSIIAQATASYTRIREVLSASDEKDEGTVSAPLTGAIEVRHLKLHFGEKQVLKDVSFDIKPRTKTAIIGPTAAGKTQLMNALVGLTLPQEGSILFDGVLLQNYVRASFYPQIGLVFQDSVLFNTTVRENIAFSTTVDDAGLQKAVETAELSEYIAGLPQGLETIVSERGTSLSGGQKQRLMLARALALNPKILFLDDFTARVDTNTEQKILANIRRNYPDLTLVSITQKIAHVEDYDQIIVLLEGEVVAVGTHRQLMETSPEYVQIYDSQRSTNTYELRS